MRILLDESVPVQVRNALGRHQVSTAVEMGWQGISNGELLATQKSLRSIAEFRLNVSCRAKRK